MRKSFVLLAALTFVAAWAVPAAAHWLPGDPHKMHWPQLPDTTTAGWDVLSSGQCTTPVCRVADDFQCAETGWVKDIHFWGSWKGDLVGQIQYFHFEIFKDNAGVPGQRIWWYDAPIADVAVVTKSAPGEGWWDACDTLDTPNNHTFYFQYNVNIPQNRWFCQEHPQVYWLSIYACVVDAYAQWGWKTSISQHYGSDGVYGFTGGPWTGYLVDPVSQETRDLAFVITGDAVPPQKVPSLSEWGVIILAMLIAAAGVVAVLRRRAALRAC